MLDKILGKEIASYIRPHRALLICALALAAASSFFVLVPAYLIQPFVDECMKTGSEPATWKIPWIAFDAGSWYSWRRTEVVLVENISPNTLLTILMLIALVSVFLKSATVYLSELSAAAFANRAVKSMRIDLLRKFVSLPLGYYHKKRSGELIARATADLTVMQGRIAHILIGLTQHPLSALVFIFYLLVMNYKLTLLVFLAGPVIIGLIRLFGRKVKKHATRVQDAMAEVTAAYQETLLCLKVIHAFFKGDFEVGKFREKADFLYKRIMGWRRWELGVGPIMDVTVFFVAPALLLIARFYFDHTLGELFAMVFAYSRLYTPIRKLGRVNSNLKTLQGATERVFAIMNTVPHIREKRDAKALPRHKEALEFKNMGFGYSPEGLVLKDISFRVEAGEMVAFVGSTGAGKSTLLDLIPRFYDVTTGSITIDGLDIRDVTLASLRRQIGFVNQDTILFHDTIANNIRYGQRKKGEEALFSAARGAHAHDFILAQPEGYETVVGDQGVMLSGGQKQRIAIARAMLVDPAILILDEAASALDSESEKHVQEAIDKLKGGPTILIVAHRLSTIMKADNIHVLEDGRIVESGTAKELLAKKGRFRQLYDLQFRNEG
ncbi:MAG: ABC transporter ATP-binding protein [Deltaproteobacteria bacterium]|nr:ABC transporter ATP-binding protein [Deltaproteobacteria bacterium]